MAGEYYIGIDIGTAFSKIGYVDNTDGKLRPDIFQFNKLSDKGLIPSAVLYDNLLNPIAFGKEAIEKYIQNSQDRHLIREFKIELGGRISLSPDLYIESEDVYEAFLQHIKDTLTAHLRSDDSSTDETIESGVICITHPAEYENDRFGERVRYIAQKVFNNPNIQIVAINEPSAIAQYVDYRRSILLVKPRNILVVDSGGGTTDFCHALASYPWLRAHPPLEIIEVDRLDIGGRDIDNNIYQVIEKKMDGRINNSLNQERILKSIRDNKEYYDWDSDEDFMIDVETESVFLDSQRLMKCVRPVMDSIVKRVQDFIELSKEPIQVIVLAGGNSKIPMLYKKLRGAFSSVEIVQVSTEDCQNSVALGAALYGNTTNPILWRLAYDIKLSYSNGKEQLLWKRNTETSLKNRVRKVVTNYDENGSIQIWFVNDDKGAPSSRPLKIKFNPKPKIKTDIIIRFEIDANGYLRYVAYPFNNKSIEKKGVIRQYVLDTTPIVY